jgi:hypothetical protein
MNHADYLEYQADVEDFRQREGLTHLVPGNPEVCEACGGEWDQDHEFCIRCGESSESQGGPWFSKLPCDCCGTTIQGYRELANGFNASDTAVKRYTICTDCAYYAEYGQLDDQTMQEVEATR